MKEVSSFNQEPSINITVGMHTGGLEIIHLPGSKLYMGSSINGATELAAEAQQMRGSPLIASYVVISWAKSHF